MLLNWLPLTPRNWSWIISFKYIFKILKIWTFLWPICIEKFKSKCQRLWIYQLVSSRFPYFWNVCHLVPASEIEQCFNYLSLNINYYSSLGSLNARVKGYEFISLSAVQICRFPYFWITWLSFTSILWIWINVFTSNQCYHFQFLMQKVLQPFGKFKHQCQRLWIHQHFSNRNMTNVTQLIITYWLLYVTKKP